MTQEKERVFTFHSNIKNEIGNAEIKFDFTESEFKKLSDTKEGENQMLSCQYAILCCVDKLRESVEKLSGKPTYISEFSIYSMKNLKSNSVCWVLIRHYWKSMNRWFPIWVSCSQMSEDTFTPATQFEKETFGCCIKNSQIIAFEDNVSDRSSAFKNAFLLLEKEAKKEQKESELS